jgi:hypothetical protein
LLDRSKPTTGCSANGRRRKRKEEGGGGGGGRRRKIRRRQSRRRRRKKRRRRRRILPPPSSQCTFIPARKKIGSLKKAVLFPLYLLYVEKFLYLKQRPSYIVTFSTVLQRQIVYYHGNRTHWALPEPDIEPKAVFRLVCLFVFGATAPQWARAFSFSRFLDHTTTHHSRQDSSGRVISSSQGPLPETHNRQTSMPMMEFEPTISEGDRPRTYALDRAAHGTGVLVGRVCILIDALVKVQWFVFRGVLFFVMTHTKRTICMYGAAPLGQVKRHFRPNILRAERTVGVPSDWNRSREKSRTCRSKTGSKGTLCTAHAAPEGYQPGCADRLHSAER